MKPNRASSHMGSLDVTAIRSAMTIRDVLAAAGCEVSSRSRRTRCPIHSGDNATAFSFNESGFHCFACGASGDVIELAKMLYGIRFTQAVAHLARLAGMDRKHLPRLDSDRADRRRTVARRRAALHAWRGERLNECVIFAEKLDRDARRLAVELTVARAAGDQSDEERCWDALSNTYSARDDLDWTAALLSEPQEAIWLARLRTEQDATHGNRAR